MTSTARSSPGAFHDELADTDCPPELHRLGRTLARLHDAIVNWHRARVTNGPTEAVYNLTKRVKRAAFGFRRFAHYRIRAFLYVGKPMRVRIEVGSTGGGGSQTRSRLTYGKLKFPAQEHIRARSNTKRHGPKRAHNPKVSGGETRGGLPQ